MAEAGNRNLYPALEATDKTLILLFADLILVASAALGDTFRDLACRQQQVKHLSSILIRLLEHKDDPR